MILERAAGHPANLPCGTCKHIRAIHGAYYLGRPGACCALGCTCGEFVEGRARRPRGADSA